MPELQARGLVVERRVGERALDSVDLDIEPGELVAIMGATGAGKSTLALALAGLLEPVAGALSGTATGEVRLVLQRPESTILEARVLDEVSLAARRRGEPVAHAERQALEMLRHLALPADIAERDPLALSGGEQRRVAIAAVLAADPRVTILDEPGAGLDPTARRELHDALERLHAAGRTLLVITHDPSEAARLATRLVVLVDGRIAWDGPPSMVLGDPMRAAALGLDVAPEVRALRAISGARGVDTHVASLRTDDLLDELARVLRAPTTGHHPTDLVASAAPRPAPAPPPPPPPLPPLVDARLRLVACLLTVVAALLASTLLAAAIVATCSALVVAAARIDRTRVRIAARPLLMLTIVLVALQLLFSGGTETDVTRSWSSDAPALAAILRALQATGVVLATLALSGATATTDLAAAIRALLGPLRVLRVPVDTLAFVVATGLGLVPAMADELERLRLAQRARGIRRVDARLLQRLRDDAQLLAPLFVAAFRRAHLLADALAVRGYDPRARHRPWRPRTSPGCDLLLLVAGVALLVVARFA
jgi:energy-coupling factor transport system ATP-binding protein